MNQIETLLPFITEPWSLCAITLHSILQGSCKCALERARVDFAS